MEFERALEEMSYTPVVKNTFIELQLPTTLSLQRCNSAPGSLCNSHGAKGKMLVGSMMSDVSTDAQTEASTCSECGGDAPTDSDYSSEASPSSNWCQITPQNQRLNSSAVSFQPKMPAQDPAKQQWNHRFEEVIDWVKKTMQQSGHVAEVQVWDDTNGWVIMVKPQAVDDPFLQSEQLLTLAKEALLDAASMSRCVYVMGYAGPKPFTLKPQGFEVTLGVMENARSACYHVFKKGFCRHGSECSKSHPACQQTVQVVVKARR